jgi:hypothetical protein
MFRENVKFLEWFIKFGQADIEGTSREGKKRWAVEVHALVSEGLLGAADYKSFVSRAKRLAGGKDYPPDITVAAAQRAHALFSTMFSEISGHLKAVFGPGGSGMTRPEGIETPDFGGLQLPDQVVEAGRRANELQAALQVESIRALNEIFGRGLEINLVFNARLYGLYKNPTTIKTNAVPKEAGKMLQAMFLKLLEGVPLQSFKWCPECGQMFIHATKRKRLYCSNLCAARRGGREHRSRLKIQRPKVYQKQKREGAARARKSYEKKIRDQGIKGKPERRPYKHKED